MSPTKEAINDAKEAAHGTDNRRDNFIAPLDLLVTVKKTVSVPTLSRWGEFKGQNLGLRGHDDHEGHVGDFMVGRDGKRGKSRVRISHSRRFTWKKKRGI